VSLAGHSRLCKR